MNNFYSYSMYSGMEYHATGEQAKQAVDDAIKAMTADETMYNAADISGCTWGEVIERAASIGEVGFARKRQDRLSYEADHPQVIDGRMEKANGDMALLKNIHDSDLLEHDLVLSIACIWMLVNAKLARFKAHTFEDITTFVQTLYDHYGTKRGGTEGNMTFTTFDRKFRLQLAIQKTIGLGPELQIARQKMLEAVDSYPPEANDLKTIVLGTFFPTDGHVQVAKVLELRTYKVDNPLWNEGMAIVDKAIEVLSRKKQIRLYIRNEQGKYDGVPLDIAAL